MRTGLPLPVGRSAEVLFGGVQRWIYAMRIVPSDKRRLTTTRFADPTQGHSNFASVSVLGVARPTPPDSDIPRQDWVERGERWKLT